MLRTTAASASLCFISLFSACTEASSPDQIPAAATISPVSPVQLTGVVATSVSTPPSVLIRDENGNPISGATVRFSITAGTGTLSELASQTNSAGIASVSSWILGTSAGVNAVAATIDALPPLRFEVIAVAGPPAALSKVAGDGQIGARGSAVPVPPQVKVTDRYNNPVSGALVSFSVSAGGGTLSGENVATDSLGLATLGSWTLGSNGSQNVLAIAEGLSPVTFQATAFDFPEDCATIAGLSERTTVDSELSVHGCQGADGRFLEYYTVRLGNGGAWRFKIASSDFNARLQIRSGTGMPIASSRPTDGKTDSEITAVLPSGSFVLVATSVDADATGHYQISYSEGISDVSGCELSIMRGFSTAQSVGSQRCSSNAEQSPDQYRIYLTAGSTVSIELDDYSLSDNLLEIRDDDGKSLAVGTARDYVESNLDYTAKLDGYYVIAVRVAERYELFVR